MKTLIMFVGAGIFVMYFIALIAELYDNDISREKRKKKREEKLRKKRFRREVREKKRIEKIRKKLFPEEYK